MPRKKPRRIAHGHCFSNAYNWTLDGSMRWRVRFGNYLTGYRPRGGGYLANTVVISPSRQCLVRYTTFPDDYRRSTYEGNNIYVRGVLVDNPPFLQKLLELVILGGLDA
jgi:hypothetical protein